jgi:hypothetical protein
LAIGFVCGIDDTSVFQNGVELLRSSQFESDSWVIADDTSMNLAILQRSGSLARRLPG